MALAIVFLILLIPLIIIGIALKNSFFNSNKENTVNPNFKKDD